MIPSHLAPNYDTGGDVTLAVGGVRLHFGWEDFVCRTVAGAAQLGLVGDPHRIDGEWALALARRAGGRPKSGEPADRWLEHLNGLLVHDGRSLDLWLRTVIVVGAWTDQLVTDHQLDPDFQPHRGFGYRRAGGLPVAATDGAPDWSAHAVDGVHT